jgi:hypothetical protein
MDKTVFFSRYHITGLTNRTIKNKNIGICLKHNNWSCLTYTSWLLVWPAATSASACFPWFIVYISFEFIINKFTWFKHHGTELDVWVAITNL